MRLPQLPKFNSKQQDRLLLGLSFALPFLGMVLLMIFSGYMPFGKQAMLYSDMWHQYYPFFRDFRRMLTSGDSLLYNWNLGMGLNYLGLMAYYLASPLNLLCLLLPESLSLYVFTFLPPLKLGLAGLFFGLFLQRVFRKQDWSIPCFAAFYALCAWTMGYQWNLMWLDGFALLPLVMLGMVQLLREKKYILYTLSLALAVCVNYYIGFFLCLFVVLAFLCYEIACAASIQQFLKDTGRIVLFSLLSAMLCAIVLIPTLDALQATASAKIEFPDDFALNIVDRTACEKAIAAWNSFKASPDIGKWFTALWESLPPIFDGVTQVLGNQNGGVEPALMSGLPNIFCGVLTNILAFLYLFCRRISLRERLCAVGLLLFLNLSFVIRQLDFIWHGFHFPNSIPYRFSFLYSFVLLCMAYRAWDKRRSFRSWQVGCAILLSLSLAVLSKDFSSFTEKLGSGTLAPEDWIYPLYNFLLIFVYALILLLTQVPWKLPCSKTQRQAFRFRRRFGSYSMLAVMVLEIVLNLLNFNSYVYEPYHGSAYSVTQYPKKADSVASMLQVIDDIENGSDFYRVEMTHTQTLNDSAINGYPGISLFSSSANASVTRYMQAMGLSARENWNQYVYKDGSPVTNLFINLKYQIHREYDPVENRYFDTVHNYDGISLLKNNAWLPLGFMVDPALAEVILPEGQVNHFAFQNQFMQAATGINQNVWSIWRSEDLHITSNQVSLFDENTGSAYCRYQADPAGGTVTYTFTAWQDGQFCVDMHLGNGCTFNVYKIPAGQENGNWLFYEGYKLTQMINCGSVSKGDQIQVVIPCGANESSSMIVRGAILDDTVFWQCYEKLSQSTLDITHFENTCVKGRITALEDGLLYTSVPQDGHWSAYVDGKKVTIQPIAEAMVGIPLSAGTHTVELRYENPAFYWGLGITLFGAALFGGICYLDHRKKRKKSEQL